MAAGTSQRVCCCGVHIWTKTIAWIEIVFFAFSTLALIQLLSTLQSRGEDKILKIIRESDSLVLSPYQDASFFAVVVLAIFLLILSIIAFVMSFVLLNGIKKENPKYLMSWIVYTTVSQIMIIIWLLNLLDGSTVVTVVLLIVLSVTLTSFSVSLVYLLKSEIEKEMEDAEEDEEKIKPREA